MTIADMNNKLQNGAPIMICPWTMAYSNQALVKVQSVAGNRTVTYCWDGDEVGQVVTKTSQVSYSTWNHIVASLNK